MKRWFLAVSLVFIIAGLAITASGYYPIKKIDQNILATLHNVPLQNRTDGAYYLIEGTTIGMFIPDNASTSEIHFNPEQWKVSANLTKGDLIEIWVIQGLDWPEGQFEIDEQLPGGYGALYVGVNVTDPRGNFTLFSIVLGRATDSSAGSASSQYPQLETFYINITDPEYNQGGLDVSPLYVNTGDKSFYMSVGGIAQFDGTYTVRVIYPWPSRKYPVTSIQIIKDVDRIVYSTAYTLPVGMTISSAGVVLSYVSLRKKPKLVHTRKMYAKSQKQS